MKILQVPISIQESRELKPVENSQRPAGEPNGARACWVWPCRTCLSLDNVLVPPISLIPYVYLGPKVTPFSVIETPHKQQTSFFYLLKVLPLLGYENFDTVNTSKFATTWDKYRNKRCCYKTNSESQVFIKVTKTPGMDGH